MAGICEGRVVVITGAGRGIGRGHALTFAREGAKVVVNDLGVEVDGSGTSTSVAEKVAEEVRAMGGEAVANGDDASDFEGAQRMIDTAISTFGTVDVLVNNAGILRDRMLFNMDLEEWDAVIRVHLRGTFCPSRIVAAYWRERSKAGEELDARIINTTSPSGIYGNPGQSNYGAAKAGIAGFTVIAARELERYGVTVNAVSPGALTRMTAGLRPGRESEQASEDKGLDEEFDPRSPLNIAPIVVWLASPQARHVTGRIFEAAGGRIGIAEGWRRGPSVAQEARWDPAKIGPAVDELLGKAAPLETMGGGRR